MHSIVSTWLALGRRLAAAAGALVALLSLLARAPAWVACARGAAAIAAVLVAVRLSRALLAFSLEPASAPDGRKVRR